MALFAAVQQEAESLVALLGQRQRNDDVADGMMATLKAADTRGPPRARVKPS
jgi:hypothetical protein